MGKLNELGLAEARDALRKGETTSRELTEACLAAIDGAGALNAFVHRTPELAMERAAAADARLAAGDAPAMCGLPIGIKDLFCTKGVPSQGASRILERFRSGASFTASDYVSGWRRLRALREIWADRVAAADAVILPTAPILPPDANRLMTDDAYYVSENLLALRNTRIGNLMGVSAITLPAGANKADYAFEFKYMYGDTVRKSSFSF